MDDSDKLVPGEQDENVGGDPPKKRREKKKKSREERVKDRRTVMAVFLVVFLITLAFYLWPKLSGWWGGDRKFDIPEWAGSSEIEM